MDETAVKMTLTDLCKAVAEEMGWPVYSHMIGEEEFFYLVHRVTARPVDWLTTGDGMLDVLKWLQTQEPGQYFSVGVRSAIGGGWNTEFFSNFPGDDREGVWFHEDLPAAVLLTFMKAVKGVGVELTDG